MHASIEQIYDNTTDHRDNLEWLLENRASIYAAIDAGVRQEQTFHTAVDMLLEVFPMMIIHDDLKRWARLLDNVIKRLDLSTAMSPEGEIVEYLIKDQFLLHRLDHMENVRHPSKRRRRVRLNPRELLENYLIVQMYLNAQPAYIMSPPRVQALLEFTRKVNHNVLYHKVYQIIAYALNRQGHYDSAIIYAQLARDYFKQAEDPVELALSLIALACALSHTGEKDRSMACHNHAKQLLKESGYADLIKAECV